MAYNAWMDSLSEDWVSQPGSDNSVGQLPVLKDDNQSVHGSQNFSSRLPRKSLDGKSIKNDLGAMDVSVLSERSPNKSSSRRLPSKLSQEFRGKKPLSSRSVSESTTGSVVHNSGACQASPLKPGQDTPEWKRRLVPGDVHYGAQRDLFCSAATGLQDMFRPLPADPYADEADESRVTMPSSPPRFNPRGISADLALEALREEGEFSRERIHAADVTPSPSPRKSQRKVMYRATSDSFGSDGSAADFSSIHHIHETPSRHAPEHSDQHEASMQFRGDDRGGVRQPSNQSALQHEDFSPIWIGKHNADDGQVEFAPIDLPVDQLRQKLETLRLNQMLLDPYADLEEGFDPEPAEQEESIQFDNTEDYGHNGGFLNLRRGGRSQEGSFHHRSLSPTFEHSSFLFKEDSVQASTPKRYGTVGTEVAKPHNWQPSPQLPKAPFPSPEKRQARGNLVVPSGGSPLKLFGPYDTFTNQTLLRRISQMEEGMSPLPSMLSPESPSIERGRSHKLKELQQYTETASSGSGGQSADDSLASYVSEGSVPNISVINSSHSSEQTPARPSTQLMPAFVFTSQLPPPKQDKQLQVGKRRKQKLSSSTRRSLTPLSSNQAQSLNRSRAGTFQGLGSPDEDAAYEGKRPRTSPSKDPTPKRRRTLHRSDISYGQEHGISVMDFANQQVQSIVGQKWKDGKHATFQLASSDVLAKRPMLKPLSPSSSRKSSANFGEESPGDSQSEESGSVHNTSPQRAVNKELQTLPNNGMVDLSRKPSIRTEDFVDQAAQIMAMIRNQVRPPGLQSVEESAAENSTPSAELDDPYDDSTAEPFSRPPSREGRQPLRPLHPEVNAELLKKLKQYQEQSELGEMLTSASSGLIAEAIQGIQSQVQGSVAEQSNGPRVTEKEDIVSDIPNIRLSRNPDEGKGAEELGSEFPSHSSGQSTDRYPSASSRGSDSRRIIMPESVSHLIPKRVGSMFLDERNNVWVKKKGSKAPKPSSILMSEDSEMDPFASIPDLSVDMTKEMQNLHLALKEDLDIDPKLLEKTPSPKKRRNGPSNGFVTLSPTDELTPEKESITRQGLEHIDEQPDQSCFASLNKAAGEQLSKEVEKDEAAAKARTRNPTISFSSPVASYIQDPAANPSSSPDGSLEVTGRAQALPQRSTQKHPRKHRSKASPKTTKSRGSAKHDVSARQAGHRYGSQETGFVPRPVSRIDEQDEDSTVEIPYDDQRQVSIIGETSMLGHRTPGRQTSLSFIVNRTPGNNALSVCADDSLVIGHNVGKLSLSPLSEFTMNNTDQSFGLEVSYIMGHRHMSTGDGSRRTMSLSIRELVDRLGEVEPNQPYWEDLTRLDLHDQRLSSLHKLDEFCSNVVTLDVSKNGLGHLDGIPLSVRELKVTSNLLTELTSWDHLMNLQYVDISDNELSSLSALKNLVHLRSLKADNNRLLSLDGLDGHDGIISLRARNNEIEELDFAFAQMDRLRELDLTGNKIDSIQNLHLLPDLSELKVAKNYLTDFSVPHKIRSLRVLDLSNNLLEELTVEHFPNLHSLSADGNYLHTLQGTVRVHKLDSLSLREQRGDQRLDLSWLSTCYEIRRLHLSGNLLDSFDPYVDFLNLQLLELSNCGLEYLPPRFGQLMPNLRNLNICFNAISDLSPLRYIPRLKKLLAAGNRLDDTTQMMEVMTEFPHLTQLDLRDNPVTMGFYPPTQVLVSTAEDSEPIDPFKLPDGDKERNKTFAERLDETTRLRRRLHHFCFVAYCRKLRSFDGLSVKRREVLGKDKLLDKLIFMGLLPEYEDTLIGEEQYRHEAKSNELLDVHDHNGRGEEEIHTG